MASIADRNVAAHLASEVGSRLILVDALRAIAATLIAWHHIANYWSYSNSENVQRITGDLFGWLQYGSSAAQAFFVISGFVMARSMSRRQWRGAEVGKFLMSRYCRLGLPYLAVSGIGDYRVRNRSEMAADRSRWATADIGAGTGAYGIPARHIGV